MENPVFWYTKQDRIESTPIGDVEFIWGFIILNQHYHFPNCPEEIVGKPLPFIQVLSIVERQGQGSRIGEDIDD